MKAKFGLKLKEEIHAARMINKPGTLVRIARNDRLTILRALLDEITRLPDVNVINVIADKRAGDTSDVVFDRTWRAMRMYFKRLKPVLCTHASRDNAYGVVHLK